MNVLIACEFSGIVRDAFRKAGHDAISVDLLPTEGSPRWHIKGDIREVLDASVPGQWDPMIAFPPCTYLCRSGIHWNRTRPERAAKTEEALCFVRLLMDALIPRVALENPVGVISSRIRKPDQVIHPHQFGHPENKATCLWLKNLPPLEPTDRVFPLVDRVHRAAPGPDRWRERSRTLPGIAAAMAAQWSRLGASSEAA